MVVEQTKTKLKKTFTGTVLKDANNKTIVVGVKWQQHHKIYRKLVKRVTKLVAHDENNAAMRGDVVLIEQFRPMSATKRWRLVDIIEKKRANDSE